MLEAAEDEAGSKATDTQWLVWTTGGDRMTKVVGDLNNDKPSLGGLSLTQEMDLTGLMAGSGSGDADGDGDAGAGGGAGAGAGDHDMVPSVHLQLPRDALKTRTLKLNVGGSGSINVFDLTGKNVTLKSGENDLPAPSVEVNMLPGCMAYVDLLLPRIDTVKVDFQGAGGCSVWGTDDEEDLPKSIPADWFNKAREGAVVRNAEVKTHASATSGHVLVAYLAESLKLDLAGGVDVHAASNGGDPSEKKRASEFLVTGAVAGSGSVRLVGGKNGGLKAAGSGAQVAWM